MLKKVEKPARGTETPDEILRNLLADVLGLARDQVGGFAESTALFGALPEFDSMAVANFLTALEERLEVVIDDDDVDAEDFASFGSLLMFVEKLADRA